MTANMVMLDPEFSGLSDEDRQRLESWLVLCHS